MCDPLVLRQLLLDHDEAAKTKAKTEMETATVKTTRMTTADAAVPLPQDHHLRHHRQLTHRMIATTTATRRRREREWRKRRKNKISEGESGCANEYEYGGAERSSR